MFWNVVPCDHYDVFIHMIENSPKLEAGSSTDIAPDADFHGLVGNMVRQKTMMAKREKTNLGAATPTYEVLSTVTVRGASFCSLTLYMFTYNIVFVYSVSLDCFKVHV